MTKLICEWCGRGIAVAPRGRPRRFCRHSCRQRAYEARRRAAELGLTEGELVMSRQDVDELRDRLWLIRQALADVVASDPDQRASDLAASLVAEFWESPTEP